MVKWDVFLTGGKCADSCMLLVFEIEIVMMKAASTAVTTLYVYFIFFYRLVTSTYISLWENQVSSKCRYCHLEYLITSLAAAVVSKSSWQYFHVGWIQFQVCLLCVQVPHAGSRHAVSKAKEVFRSTSRKCLEEAESEWEFTQSGVQTCKTAVDT